MSLLYDRLTSAVLLGLVGLSLVLPAHAGPPSVDSTGPFFLRGDSNGDGRTDISDASSTLDFLFREGATSPCLDAADANDDGQLDISDAVATLLFLFSSKQSLPYPGQLPGPDRSIDDLPPCQSLAITSLWGTVIREGSRAPLAGVTVSIDAATTTTQADGRFWLKGPPLGAQRLRVDATRLDPAFVVREVPVEVRANTVASVGEIALAGDAIPPSGTLTINSGDSYTRSVTVTLALSASDNAGNVTRMRFSNDNKTYTAAELFATTRSWRLSDGDGVKTVYIQFQDNAGNWSGPVSDTILLDTVPPTGSIAIQGDAAYTTTREVSLTLTASDAASGVYQMRFSLNRGTTWTTWEDFASPRSLTLPSGDGNKEVRFQLQDRAGNQATFTDAIVLDTVVPTGSVTINGGAAYTLSLDVEAAVTASDATAGIEAVRFSTDGSQTWTNWEARFGNTVAFTRSLTLLSGTGNKTVLCEIRDRAGHTVRTQDDILVPRDVTMVNTGTYYEITNGLTGVRIPLAESYNPLNPRYTLAPIQSIRQADGTWSNAIPVYLSTATAPTGMTVRILKETLEEVITEVSYTFDKPAFYYGDQFLEPAGPGSYKTTLTVQKGEPLVMVEVDGDYEVSYSLSITEGLYPTHARYRGRVGEPAMDTTADLSYDERMDFPNVPAWNPWTNGGRYWQLFNTPAGPEANLLGIFAGRASKAIGAHEAVSGVHLYTGPEAVTDEAVSCDNEGNCHFIWQTANELWYLLVDSSGRTGQPERIARDLINPYVAARGGRVLIVAFDSIGGPQGKGQFLLFQRSGGTFQSSPIDLGSTTILEPHGYFTSSSVADFLLVFGERQGQRGFLLFARNLGESNFTFQEAITDVYDQEQRDIYSRTTENRRPDFRTLSDGRVVLLYTDFGGWTAYRAIVSGQRRFTLYERFLGRISLLNAGAAIDSRTGRMMVVDAQTDAFSLLIPNGEQLAATEVKTAVGILRGGHDQGPNRRTLATDDQGNVLATSKEIDTTRWVVITSLFLYRSDTQGWERLTAANALGIDPLVVTYDSVNRRFNLLGRYQGRLAHFTYAVGEGAPRLIQIFEGTERPVAGLQVCTGRRSPDNRFWPRIRYEWGIFAGVKGQDLKDPLEIQPIALAMNRHGGLADGRLERYETADYPDSPNLQGGLFMPAEVVQRMIQRVRTDSNYYQYLYSAEPTIRDLIDAWRDRSGVKLREAIASVLNVAEQFKKRLVEGDGIYDFFIHYWHGGLETIRSGIRIAMLLVDDRTTPEERRKLKEAAALFGSILWDDDFVPLSFFLVNGLNAGTENMPIQQLGYRNYYTLLLQGHPNFTERAQEVAEQTLQILRRIINEYGAEIGSTSYIAASLEPTLIQALQLKQSGVADLFRTDDRLRKFSEFYMNLLTPKEVRFGNRRKLVSIGDASTVGTEIPGLLATGFRDVDPDLSARLMGAWNQGGKVHIGFFGSTLLMIDEAAPEKDPALGDGNFPGYNTVFRHGWGTPNESTVHFINGDHYRDHRHNDHGSVVLYGLGVPISIDWGSFYEPSTSAASMHSLVTPSGVIPWSASELSSMGGFGGGDFWWGRSIQNEVALFRQSPFSVSSFTPDNRMIWTRSVRSIRSNPALPIFSFQDRLTPTGEYVFTLNLMASGEVETPVGRISPPLRSYQTNGPMREMPSLGDVFLLPAGINRLGFTGQWGIDFDVYVVSDQAQEARIGNWAHNWHPNTEQNEFRIAQGRPFEERQHILRIKGTGGFNVLLLPYRRGQKPADLQVTQEASGILMAHGNERTIVGEQFTAHTDGSTDSLATLGAEAVERFGIQISGGSAEVEKRSDRVLITVHGNAGLRRILIPGNWQPEPGSEGKISRDPSTGEWLIDYSQGDPLTLSLQPA